MTIYVFANNVNTTLAASASNTATTLLLSSSANLPIIPSGEVLPLTLNDAATGQLYEIVYVTAISGATLTVLRAQEGTGAQNWAVGDYAFAPGVTAGVLQTLETPTTNTAVFVANGSWTVPPNVTSIQVSAAGGGGGGGGGNSINSTTQGGGGGGGFAGQIVIKAAIAVTPGAVLTVTIGAGGAGGLGLGGSAPANASAGVAGGTTTLVTGPTTLLTLPGGAAGGGAFVFNTSYVYGGTGFAQGLCLAAHGATGTSGNNGYGGVGQGTAFGGGGAGGNSSAGGGVGGGAGAGGGGGAGAGVGGGGSTGGHGNAGILIMEW